VNDFDTESLRDLITQGEEAQRNLLPGNRNVVNPKLKKLAIRLRNPSLMKALGKNPINEEDFGELAKMLRIGRG
jgi:hypothetical protein